MNYKLISDLRNVSYMCEQGLKAPAKKLFFSLAQSKDWEEVRWATGPDDFDRLVEDCMKGLGLPK